MHVLTAREQYMIDKVVDRKVDGILEKSEIAAFMAIVEGHVDEGEDVKPEILDLYVHANMTLATMAGENPSMVYWRGLHDAEGGLICDKRNNESIILADIMGDADGFTTIEELIDYRVEMCIRDCVLAVGKIQLDEETALSFLQEVCDFNKYTKDGLFFDAALLLYSPTAAFRVWEGVLEHEQALEQESECFPPNASPSQEEPQPIPETI